jgi:hypothetical protein
MRPRIAVDIDGVLADIHVAVFRRLGLSLCADKTELREYLFFVDDNPNMTLRDRERVIIYDRPWNRGIDGVRRIRSLGGADMRATTRYIRCGHQSRRDRGGLLLGWGWRVPALLEAIH